MKSEIQMQTLAIWFEDLTLCPDRAERGVTPAKGMPEDWMDAIAGAAKIERRRHVAPGILSAVVVSLPDPWHFEHFTACFARWLRSLVLTPGCETTRILVISSFGIAVHPSFRNTERRSENHMESLATKIAALIPAGSDDSAMWKNRMADQLDAMAEADDLTLLRAGKDAEQFEKAFRQFVESGFPCADVVLVDEGKHYNFAVGIARLDRDLRQKVLRSIAEMLRKN